MNSALTCGHASALQRVVSIACRTRFAEPGMPEAGVGVVHSAFGRGPTVSGEHLAGQHALLDHLVRSQQQRVGDGDAEGLGRLEVDGKLESLRPFYRQFTRLGTL